ncbi:MAG: ATP-dependent Clp protease adaptor ClpS [Bacteroidales bacterium]
MMTERSEKIGKPLEDHEKKAGIGETSFLILHNDDIHSIDYVIQSLVDVCNHEQEQAEQCTLIAHYKGSCDVRKGSIDKLLPMKEGLTSRGLLATID